MTHIQNDDYRATRSLSPCAAKMLVLLRGPKPNLPHIHLHYACYLSYCLHKSCFSPAWPVFSPDWTNSGATTATFDKLLYTNNSR